MNNFFKFLAMIFLLQSCAYEPVYLNKNYNFKFLEIISDGDVKINNSIKNYLKNNTNGSENYNLYFKSLKRKEIVTYDTKGDPKIYKIIINLQYQVSLNGKKIIEDQIIKGTTYNNIKDKYELTQYENNVINNLSDNISRDILFAIKTLN
tara:strand:- start:291 stop:740 length:450 start_codon:yes stop_codon:yes gene_type:complete